MAEDATGSPGRKGGVGGVSIERVEFEADAAVGDHEDTHTHQTVTETDLRYSKLAHMHGLMPIDGEPGEDGMIGTPGAPGPQGAPGGTGPPGVGNITNQIFWQEDIDFDEPIPIPGKDGPEGGSLPFATKHIIGGDLTPYEMMGSSGSSKRAAREDHSHAVGAASGAAMPFLIPDDIYLEEAMIVPGPAGAGTPGAPGAQGIPGPIGPALMLIPDDIEIPEPMIIVGPRGATGTSGGAGAAGSMGPPGLADDPEEPLLFPGPPGPQGIQGVPGGGGGGAFTLFTKDLGAARRDGTFDITGLSGLTADKVVAIVQSAAPITSKGDARDEPEMDHISATGYVVNTTTIRAYWNCPSVVVGTYSFGYMVSG